MDSLLPSLMYSYRSFTQGPVNMYNCKDVTISSSTFENNCAQSVFRDLPYRVPGGGLSITIFSNLTHDVMHRARPFAYTIQNCTFSNNNATSTVATADTSTLLNLGFINNRGGGVALYMVHPSVVKVNILRCNFINNFAPYFGGGLYIFSPKLVTEEDFTVADSYFEGNEAELGGGIALGAVFQETEENSTVLIEKVVLTRNTLLRNNASFGGGMFLGPGEP